MDSSFSFYGYEVEVSGESETIVAEVGRDFAWFKLAAGSSTPQMRLDLHLEAPQWKNLPPVPAAVITPRNVTFKDGDVTYIDYFGKGLAVLNRQQKTCVMYAPEFDLLREMAYLFLLSTVGQHLDSLGLHRIHAMGVNHNGRGVLLLLPSGGGKSTMSLELLAQPDFTLLSEDTPLLDRNATIHPFPLRLGVRGNKSTQIPDEHQRTFNRMEFDPKTFVDVDFFRHKLSESVPVSMILVGERNLGDISTVTPLSKFQAFKAVLKYLVVGLGVYQGLEFLLERGIWDMTSKLGVFSSRLRNGLALISHAPAYKITLGRDTEKNSRILIEFIRRSNTAGLKRTTPRQY